MAIATGLAIGLGATYAASKVAGAAISAHGASKAAQVQEQAAKRAEGVHRDVYQEQRDLQEPYLAMGRSGANSLLRLATPGQRYTPQMQRGDAARLAPPSHSQILNPRPDVAQPRPDPRQRRTLGAVAQGGGGGMVMMVSPDGSTRRAVPADQVDHYMQQGAKPLGGGGGAGAGRVMPERGAY